MSRPVAIVTGSSSGIGKVFARSLAPNHDLILVARRRELLDDVARSLRSEFGSQVEVVVADLCKPTDLALLAARVAEQNDLVMLVNNAGFGAGDYFWESDLDDLRRMHALHVMATLELTHAALRNMVPKNNGCVILVSSMGALMARAGSTSYRATKAWMVSFAEGLSLELRCSHSKVAVQVLCPGFTESEFQSKRGITPSTLAKPSFWLTANEVVAYSLREAQRGTPLVIPGWRYRWMAAIIPRLPWGLRSKLQRANWWMHKFCPGLTYSARRPDRTDKRCREG